MQHVVFCGWHFSLSVMYSGAIHVIAEYFIAEYYYIVRIYHILFIYLSVDAHLGCFSFMSVWITLPWTFLHKFCWDVCFHFFWVVYLGVELLDYMVTLNSDFIGTDRYSKRAMLYYTPAITDEMSICPRTIPSSALLVVSFIVVVVPSSSAILVISFVVIVVVNSYPMGCEVVSHCGFDFHVQND